MDTGPTAAAAAHAVKPHHQAQLISKGRLLKFGLTNAGKSHAARHKLRIDAIQLAALVDELHATDIVREHAGAIRMAIEARAWDAARQALAAFEQAVQSKPAELPKVPAPTPIAVATAANDNHDTDTPIAADALEREQDGPAHERIADAMPANHLMHDAHSDVPERDHTVLETAPVVQLGEAIRAARARVGKSQQDVATAAGVGRRFVGEVEAGKPTSEIGRFLSVCAAVGLSIVAVPE